MEERIRRLLPADPREATRGVKKIFARERRPEELPAYAAELGAAILEIIRRRPPEA